MVRQRKQSGMKAMSKLSKNIFFYAPIALSLMSISTVASATKLVKLTDSATLQQQQGERYFSQSGISGEVAEVIETAGADMQLSLATKQIIPDTWVIKPSGAFDSAVVSWKGGMSWPLIMNNIAQSEGIYITLDWIGKIASIHVPGQTKSELQIAKDNTSELDEERQQFRKKQRQAWEAKNFRDSQLYERDKQFENMLEKQKLSQKANQDYIANLGKTNRQLESNLNEIRTALELEQSKNKELIEKYAVIDPSLKPEKEKDAVELFSEYEKQWVLPFDSSFTYYKNGGHSDIIEAHTPASYLAKKGSVEYVLQRWAERVGWYVEYSAGIQHKNPYETEIKGSFIEASTALIRVFEKSKRPLDIDYFPDVIIEMEDGTKRKGLVKVTDLGYK